MSDFDGVPYCPLIKDDCHRRCAFKSVVGCELRSAMIAASFIQNHLSQIASDLSSLASDPETVVDSLVESM